MHSGHVDTPALTRPTRQRTMNNMHNDGMMRRRGHQTEPVIPAENETTKRFERVVKSFDMFPKLDEGAGAVNTEEGGTLSMISLVVMIVLFLSEFWSFISVDTVEHLVVDTTIGQKISIQFDLTFHALSCQSCGIDAMDVTGDQQVNVIQKVTKQRIGKNGEPLGAAQDIRADHPLMGALAMLKPKVNSGEGCRIAGSLLVNKVAGNFHVALGTSHSQGMRHVHHFMISDIPHYNSSHTINHLSFGIEYPGQKRPLDGVTKILQNEGGGVFQYFIKIIPTVYYNWRGAQMHTNAFSVTDQFKPIAKMRRGQMFVPQLPGVFFVYDLSQFMVEVRDSSPTFAQFLVNVCAIIGGVFTVTGIIDRVVHYVKQKR